MNLLLPYGPDNLERLTSSCTSCGNTLGWRYAKGIGVCEHCEREVPPSACPPLDRRLAHDYRLFAGLASLDGREVDGAMRSMPRVLQPVPSSTLVPLALQLGGIVQGEHARTTSRVAVLQIPAPALADVVTSGAAFLRSWPDGFGRWLADTSERLRTDPPALRELRSRLQRLVARGRGTDMVADLVASEMPDLRRHAVHGFADERTYYLYKEVQKRLGLDATQMEALRASGGVRYRHATSSAHQRGRFDADQIDALAPAFRRSVQFTACTGVLKLPRYAIEQCCRPGLLEREDEPLFMAIKSRTSVRPSSLDCLLARLLESRTSAERPSRSISLSVASKRIGGRRKPWGSIMEALLEGHLDYWLEGDRATVRTIHVDPADMTAFDGVVDDPARFGIPVAPKVSQADAAEILNLKHDHLPKLYGRLGLTFKPEGRALLAPLEEVLEVARQVAWNAEIGWHLGVTFREADEILRSRNVAPWKSVGWCRRQLIAEGILPAALD